LFSTFDADTVFTALKEFAEVKSLSYDVATGKYKVKMMFIVGKNKSAQNVEISVKILKVNDDKICIDF